MKKPLTAERLREVVRYEPETGIFYWRIQGAYRRNPGDVAGSPSKDGRIRIRIDGTLYYRYRLAWLYVTGSWPEKNIEHINGDPTDDKWENLRDVSQIVNCQNRKRANRGSSTGVLGIHKSREGNYVAQIKHKGKRKTIGTFPTPEAAHLAYVNAKRQIHPGNTL